VRTDTFQGGQQVDPHPRPDGAEAEPSPELQTVSRLVLSDSAWRGVFDDYRHAMRAGTEATDAFHFSTLLVRAGMALGRRVWFYCGERLYPNF
jgi:hypothetical protein